MAGREASQIMQEVCIPHSSMGQQEAKDADKDCMMLDLVHQMS
jgi:hypothetical protein